MSFKKGHKYAKGGPRPGAGRKPGWLKTMACELVEGRKLVLRLAEMASGERLFPVIDGMTGQPVKDKKGREIRVGAPPKVQKEAIVELLDRADGKPVQTLANDKENPLPAVAVLPFQDKGEAGGIFPSK